MASQVGKQLGRWRPDALQVQSFEKHWSLLQFQNKNCCLVTVQICGYKILWFSFATDKSIHLLIARDKTILLFWFTLSNKNRRDYPAFWKIKVWNQLTSYRALSLLHQLTISSSRVLYLNYSRQVIALSTSLQNAIKRRHKMDSDTLNLCL